MADTDIDSPAIQELRRLGIPYSLFVHPGPVTTLAQAAAERGQTPDQIVRSILFRLSETEYVMALMPGPRQISWKNLRKALGTNRLTLADANELKQITGYEIGAVNPFGLPRPVKIMIDSGLLAMDEVSLGSGIRGTGLIMKTSDLIHALPGCEILDLSSEG